MAKKQRHEEEEHENHERWLVTYADMLTLLMVLFIVLFAMSSLDAQKFAALRDSLAGVKSTTPSVLQGQQSVLEGGQPQLLDSTAQMPKVEMDLPSTPDVLDTKAASAALLDQKKKEKAREDEDRNLEQIKEEIEASLAAHGLSDAVKFTKDKRGLTITIVTDKVLFDVGKANIRDEADPILDALGPPLKTVPNDISIEGHTDNSPIKTAQFDSNWELSTARATSVLRYLVEQEGVGPNRVGATGYGAERAAVPNDSDAHRSQNRRVEVVVLSSVQD